MNSIISHTNVEGFKPNRVIQSFIKSLDTYSAQGRSHISHLQLTFLSLDLFLSSETRKSAQVLILTRVISKFISMKHLLYIRH